MSVLSKVFHSKYMMWTVAFTGGMSFGHLALRGEPGTAAIVLLANLVSIAASRFEWKY